jgi:hypothetical protein
MFVKSCCVIKKNKLNHAALEQRFLLKLAKKKVFIKKIPYDIAKLFFFFD